MMKFNRLGLVLVGAMAVGLFGCPAPSEKEDVGGEAGQAGSTTSSTAGKAGSTAGKTGGTAGKAGSPGSGEAGKAGMSGGEAGKAGGEAGKAGMSGGQAGMQGTPDAAAPKDTAPTPADTASGEDPKVAFKKIYTDILQPKCGGCHGNGKAHPWAKDSADNSYAAIVNMTGTDCTAKKLIAPADPDNSVIVQAMKGTVKSKLACDDPPKMPPNGTVDAADITRVENWVKTLK